MDKSAQTWIEEFTVTPLISHAVEVLRAAIPRRGNVAPGGEGITIKREFGIWSADSSRIVDEVEGTLECNDFTLTEELSEATNALLAVFAYHLFLIEQTYERPTSEETEAFAHAAVYNEPSPARRLTAQDNFKTDVERKLNISFENVDASNGSITILS